MKLSWTYWEDKKPERGRDVLFQDAVEESWIGAMMRDGKIRILVASGERCIVTQADSCLRWVYLDELEKCLRGDETCAKN